MLGRMGEIVVLPAAAPERAALEAAGWRVTARSFGAQLDTDRIDRGVLQRAVDRAAEVAPVRPLGPADVDAVLALDAATVSDYPGSAATRHTSLDRHRATPSAQRRAFGAVSAAGDVVAMTFVDVDDDRAETDFTVVHAACRRRGLGTAVKAASVLALAAAGVEHFRTGGSADNPGIIAANEALGYVRDEEWVSLESNA